MAADAPATDRVDRRRDDAPGAHPVKRVLLAIGAGVVVLLLLLAIVPRLVDLGRYKPRLEAAASDALGMQVRVDGRLGVGFLPGIHLTADDGRIVGEGGATIASAKRVTFRVALLPLLRREFRLSGIELTRPTLTVEKHPDGRLGVEKLRKAAHLLGALDGARVSLSDGSLRYADLGTGAGIVVTGYDLDVDRLRFTEAKGMAVAKSLTFRAEITCDSIRTRTMSLSSLKASVSGTKGVFDLAPVTLRLFGGEMAGSIHADVTGPAPLAQVRCTLPQFQIEQFLRTMSPGQSAGGTVDFSATMAMQGSTRDQLVRSATGTMSLRGRDLTLAGTDLDGALARFESSQSFNLVDVGAVFLAGPVGLAVTKGYNFASLFRGTGGDSRIGALVSDWTIEHGVAQARDVALATAEHRMALTGGLDFAQERFVDVTVAVVDAEGCARMRQVIRGSFANPEVEKPRILRSLAGPVLKLYGQARGLFPAGPCDVFYSGSVVAPK